ncbi:MAG: DNA-directed RNA polymerase subunit omega, partial [Deltaproteobacteria bacterium]|nr:DNA-directed RNA polymerase subunit omega [Deltaproteobacteria bacterium]
FNLIQLAVDRIKQHRQGEPYLIEAKNKEVVMTLREIAAGKVTFENIDELPQEDDESNSEELGEEEEGVKA